MGLRIRFDAQSEYVAPKTEGLNIEEASFPDILGFESSVSKGTGALTVGATEESNNPEDFGDQWLSLNLNIDLSEIEKVAEVVTGTLETIDKITQVFVVILKILRILSSDLKNISLLLKMALKVVIKQLRAMIEGLTSLGVYACVINPDFSTSGKKYAMPISGGFREFQSRVNASLLNSSDPGAPKFGEGDTVGGVFLASIAGINDPEILSNLLHNFKIIGKFFNFKGFDIPPPKGVRAIPGLYDKNGVKKLGVKVSWTSDLEYVSGFEVTRNKKNKKGVYIETNTPEKTIIEIFDNKDFNSGLVVDIKQTTAKTSYSYVDFDVEDNTLYFYKVYSYLGSSSEKFFERNPTLRDLSSTVGSAIASARPRNKIPLSALKGRTLLDDRGSIVLPLDLAGEWKSISMRSFLGPAIDKLFDKIDNIADILEGSITTGSSALMNYIEFMQKKIRRILKVLTAIEDIIKIIAQFSFRGTLAMLKLSPEVGGMSFLAQRFNDACSDPNTSDGREVFTAGGASDSPIATRGEVNPFNGAGEEGIMFGLILVYGFPQIDGEYFKRYNKPIQGVGKSFEDRIEESKKSIDVILGLLGLG